MGKKFTLLGFGVLTIVALVISVLIFPAIPALAEMEYRFVDKDSIETDFAWGKNDIIEAIDFELYKGYPDSTLRLGNDITRAEFAAVLARCIDVSGDPGPNWYDSAVDGLVKLGVIPDKGGDWNAPITRLEMAQWLGRLAKVYNLPEKDLGAAFSDTYDEDALRAARAGLVKGVSAGVLGADQYLNRAQAAVLLFRVARSVDTNLPTDEELIQARKEALEDVNANIVDFETRRNVDLSFYDKLPYKRVTRTYFEGERKFMYANKDNGRKNVRIILKEARIAEKHNSIAYVVSDIENEKGYKGYVVSRFKKIDGRWMMTQSSSPQNMTEWKMVKSVGW
ncbi:S-layer homology domain-containing protein [Thermanaeromonas toyohensis ToBE]|uniref:S-layer homology domain-containing protein n=1 Tax=Thermanaeromonas toyohensis ToBE TaxID=698762 RepID=A0A1W1VTA9_9FIRM|nr:S-layer homology domain-containing protein [Thermanaeromonas toyohensis]SMB96503.1 S-layer homology domain-containing protein [Thermanaeromonas toyohensis ToBE]